MTDDTGLSDLTSESWRRASRIYTLAARVQQFGPDQLSNADLAFLAVECKEPHLPSKCVNWTERIAVPVLHELGKRLRRLDWIDPKEQQPEHEQQCLVFLDAKNLDPALYCPYDQICRAMWIATDRGGFWVSAEFDENKKVLFWKPLLFPEKDR
jgi:hypothetical protein